MIKDSRIKTVFLLAMITIFSLGCETQKKEQKEADIKSEILKKLSEKNEELSGKIEDLVKEANGAGVDAKYQIEETIDKLKKERKKIDRTIKKVNKSTEKEAQKLKKEADKILGEAGDQITKLTDNLKNWLKSKKD